MTDRAALRELCLAAVQRSGLAPVGELFHRFEPGRRRAHRRHRRGAAGRIAPGGAHLAELGAVTLDVYVCNFGADNSRARALLAELEQAFAPAQAERHEIARGARATIAPA